ncbi:transglutaminase family protein [Spirulina subsalsa FACHB-351]|uniref:Transglutaminase family protein n=1 Tax=Spirulina subsalsa FACHB-351 TaxID=234711 RepID=A0ABT3L166_9CYAN|nr:transglutaminase family protein [Spirulina subsalsa]MCW6034947.1 transglutaminase family protein [Spirulina subsalsa FACHB-351]
MTLKVSLHHKLHYHYSQPVFLGPHTLGLRPSPHCRTPIQSYNITIQPSNYSITWQQDPYGNYLSRLNFPQKTQYLSIDVDLIAEMRPINPFNFVLEQYAINYPFAYEYQLAKELEPFLATIEAGDLLQSWIQNNQYSNIYTPNFIIDLNQKLAQEITHIIRLEEGIQTCEETLDKKVGSCRDTAWLFVQILRHYGLAARFVSGYLIQLQEDIPPLDDSPSIKEDCGDLHAWTEVYLPGAGWIGFDPTSGYLAAEGHIPLVCTAEPGAASPVQGTTEPCESSLDFAVTVTRHEETPRVTKPYSEQVWKKIDQLGQNIEDKLDYLGVGLTMGGEPTFVSVKDLESAQWQVEALGEDKYKLAKKLLERLETCFSQGGGLLHYGSGKWYPGEILPRWALGCYWRKDGVPLWQNSLLRADEDKDYKYGVKDAHKFIHQLGHFLGVDASGILPVYEVEKDEAAGYILPILSTVEQETLIWTTCKWSLKQERLELLVGDSTLGFRLPLEQKDWAEELVSEAIFSLDHDPVQVCTEPSLSPDDSIRIALGVQVRGGVMYVFIPPFSSVRGFVDLMATIEKTAETLKIPVILEGYTPPGGGGIVGFQITPDPGVIEVNIHPASCWDELVKIQTALYEQARLCGLGSEKYMRDGRRVSTGGGSHITIGGQRVEESPLLRRPDLLRSLISYFQNHPSLSYLFSGLFVGPTSQSPRVDEARHESLYELELAFQSFKPFEELPAWLVDRLLRNLLIDVTGNTHRTAFCIDKLYPVDNFRNQLGLLEFRSFAMAPHAQMSLLQMLLIRGLVAWFWDCPYERPLVRWGTMLQDRFLLPHFIGEDLNGVIVELREAGFLFEWDWFAPFFEFRFPFYGEIVREGMRLELRHGIEPWLVLGEEISRGGTARYVDDSMERLQVKLEGAIAYSPNADSDSGRYAVTCNGLPVPLRSTGKVGEYVAGVRYRARQYASQLHPAIAPHSPLLFDIVDTWTRRSIGGCTYHVTPPNGMLYETFPINPREAESRMMERFVPMGHSPGVIELPPVQRSPEFPLTLDLRLGV